MPTLDLHGGINKYAVYNGATDAPLTSPLSNLSNVLWHSDFKYIGAVTTLTGTVDIGGGTWPAIAGDFNGASEKIIAAHGRSYAPFILGKLGTYSLPAQGTFYMRPNGISRGTYMYNISCNTTHVKISRKALYGLGTPTTTNLTYSIDILNIGTKADGSFFYPTAFSGFEATTTRLRCGYFDTNDRHYIQTASGDLGIFTGASFNVAIGRPNYISGTFKSIGIVFNYGSFTNSFLSTTANNVSFSPSVLKIAKK